MEDPAPTPSSETVSSGQPTDDNAKTNNNDTILSNQEKAMETNDIDDDASSQATIDVAINGIPADNNSATDTPSNNEVPSTSDITENSTTAEASKDASAMEVETNAAVQGLTNSDSINSAAEAENADEEQPWTELVRQLVNSVKDATDDEGTSADRQQIVVIVGDDDAKENTDTKPLENGTNSDILKETLDKMKLSQDSVESQEFRCWYCEEVFDSSTDWEEHEKQHTESNFVLLICQECGQSFRKSEEFEKHHRRCGMDDDDETPNEADADSISLNGRLPCVFCDFFFDDKESLRKHLVLRHQMVQDNSNSKMYACKFCEENFSDRALILAHESKHTKSTRFQCSHCWKDFTNKGNLVQHERTHTKETLECPHCKKKHATEKDLNNHIRIMHTSSFNRLTCEYCYVVFVTRKDLIDHLKNTHNVNNMALANLPSDTNYVCGDCGKEFDHKAKRQFDKHILTHTRDNLHTCDECGKTFVRARELGYHKARHRGEGKYICGLCKKNFVLKWNLKKHLKTVHDIDKDGSFDKKPPLKKPKLMDLTDQNTVMQDIFKVNPYICRICHAQFEGGKELQAHRKMHAEEEDGKLDSFPFICSFCRKGFQNKSDFVEHVGLHTKGTTFPRTFQHIAPKPTTGSTIAQLVGTKQSNPAGRIRPKKELEKGEGIDFWKCCYSTCRRLTTTYHSKEEFAAHVKTHMRRDNSVCNYCGRCFSRPRDLMYHKKESGVRPCKYMYVKPPMEGDEEASMSQESETVSHKCGCGEVFDGFKQFQLHVLSHKSTESKMYCQYCGRNFPGQSELQNHLKVNSSDPCMYASGKEVSIRIVANADKTATPKKNDKSGDNKDEEDSGVRQFSPVSKGSVDKPYVCGYCGKAFRGRSYLREHETMHTREAPYPCDQCDRRFTRARELRYHLEKHDGHEPLSCNECQKRFITKTNYRTHMENVHEKGTMARWR